MLLQIVASDIYAVVGHNGEWLLVVTFVSLISIITSFISHTVGALVLLPIVASAACSGSDGDTTCDVRRLRALVMSSAFMCSGSMALPVSSFPNMAVVSIADEGTGDTYLQAHQLIPYGIGLTSVSAVVVCALYPLVSAIVDSS